MVLVCDLASCLPAIAPQGEGGSLGTLSIADNPHLYPKELISSPCNILIILQDNFASPPVFGLHQACSGCKDSVGSFGFPLVLFSVAKDVIELIGVVEESYPNTTFKVRITSEEAKDHTLLCHLAGRMRVNKVRILPGDKVKLEMTPYDLHKGRIVYRFRAEGPTVPGSAPVPPVSRPS